MKLRNKKTGEIAYVEFPTQIWENTIRLMCVDDINKIYTVKTIAKLNEEWEDYEEDENFYVIGPSGKVGPRFKTHDGYEEDFKEIGNYFETKEEAEKVVEKLKVLKRLKDNVFRFETYGYDRVTVKNGRVNITIKATFDEKYGEGSVKLSDLDLLFGGEE